MVIDKWVPPRSSIRSRMHGDDLPVGFRTITKKPVKPCKMTASYRADRVAVVFFVVLVFYDVGGYPSDASRRLPQPRLVPQFRVEDTFYRVTRHVRSRQSQET